MAIRSELRTLLKVAQDCGVEVAIDAAHTSDDNFLDYNAERRQEESGEAAPI